MALKKYTFFSIELGYWTKFLTKLIVKFLC